MLAWIALTVALGASIAANVAFARPALGPQLSAGVAPILVVLATGLLERAPLADGRRWQRGVAGAGLVFVTAAAFITSFQHQYALLLSYGNPRLSAVLLPLAVDALIVMASVCLAVIAEQRRSAEHLAEHPAKQAQPERSVAEQAPAEQPSTDRAAEQAPAERQPSALVERSSAGIVRSIASARRAPSTRTERPSTNRAAVGASTDSVATNMARLRDHFADDLLGGDVPSGRAIAQVLGCSPSTGDGYRKRLLAEQSDPDSKEESA